MRSYVDDDRETAAAACELEPGRVICMSSSSSSSSLGVFSSRFLFEDSVPYLRVVRIASSYGPQSRTGGGDAV